MQPRWLIAQFEELTHQTDYQDDVCTNSVSEVARIQALSREYLQRASQEHYTLQQQLEQRAQQFRRAKQQFVKQQGDTTQLHDDCIVLQASSDDAADEAKQTLNEWQNQRGKARAWLTQASNRVSLCQREVATAERAYNNAEAALRRAEAILAHRRTQTESVYVGTDSKGNARYQRRPVSTAAEEAAVSAAAFHCRSCASTLSQWTQALGDAQRDLNAAEQQCHGCENACRDADAAKQTSFAAQNTASESESSALQAVRKLEDVAKGVEHSERLLQQLHEQLSLQATMLQNLDKQVELGQTSLRDIQQQLDGLSQFMYRLKQILNDKAALLMAFERPLTFC